MSNSINTIVSTFAQGFPHPGVAAIESQAQLGSYDGAVAIDIHGAFTGTLTVFVANSAALTAAGTDLEVLITPALEAAAAEAGAQTSAPAQPGTPSDNASISRVTFGEGEEQVVVWFVIEETIIEAVSTDYDLAEVARIENVPLDVSVVVGKTTMTIAEVLSMKPGQVVDLDRAAGSPVDVLVNGEHVAAGEVVVLDQDYGVKITRVIKKSKAS